MIPAGNKNMASRNIGTRKTFKIIFETAVIKAIGKILPRGTQTVPNMLT